MSERIHGLNCPLPVPTAPRPPHPTPPHHPDPRNALLAPLLGTVASSRRDPLGYSISPALPRDMFRYSCLCQHVFYMFYSPCPTPSPFFPWSRLAGWCCSARPAPSRPNTTRSPDIVNRSGAERNTSRRSRGPGRLAPALPAASVLPT